MASRPQLPTRPDERVPPIVVVPIGLVPILTAGDAAAAQTGFVLASLVALLLVPAGRIDRRRVTTGWARPGVALAWALGCVGLATILPAGLVPGARAAAGSSVAVALLVHVVPGTWTWDGLWLASRSALGLPTARLRLATVLARFQSAAVVAGLLLLPTRPAAGAVLAAAALVALVAERPVRAVRDPADRPSPTRQAVH
jgi:hypothetical protein